MNNNNGPPKPTVAQVVTALASPQPPDVYTRWHIERSIPVAVLMAIFIQSLFGVWWLAGLTYEINESSRRLTRIEEARVAAESRAQPLLERFYKVEIEMEAMRKQIDNMNTRIDRNEEYRRQQQKLNQLVPPPREEGG